MKPVDLLTALRRTVDQLAASTEIAKALTSTLETHEVLRLIMKKVSELLKPTHWSLILKSDDGLLRFEIAVGEDVERLKQMTLKPGEGIAGRAFQQGVTILVDEAERDPAFARRFDEALGFSTGSVLAVPLKSRGEALGVIELVNTRGGPKFSEEDLQTATSIAEYAAIALQNARDFKKVQELTITDEHTGLFNARHLRALLEQEVERARRFDHPLSLLFLDLDRFKQVNDAHGHLVGSALLREVGEVLRPCIRQVDSAFRYGGDEFAVLLIETDEAGASQVAERVCESFRERRFLAAEGLGLTLTASIGYATFPHDGTTVDNLIRAADEAMYRVKARGRNGCGGPVASLRPLVRSSRARS